MLLLLDLADCSPPLKTDYPSLFSLERESSLIDSPFPEQPPSYGFLVVFPPKTYADMERQHFTRQSGALRDSPRISPLVAAIMKPDTSRYLSFEISPFLFDNGLLA